MAETYLDVSPASESELQGVKMVNPVFGNPLKSGPPSFANSYPVCAPPGWTVTSWPNANNASPQPVEPTTRSASVIISTKLQPAVSFDKPCRSARGV
jgi:hypothetical protein